MQVDVAAKDYWALISSINSRVGNMDESSAFPFIRAFDFIRCGRRNWMTHNQIWPCLVLSGTQRSICVDSYSFLLIDGWGGYRLLKAKRTRHTVRFFTISAIRTWHFLFLMAFTMEQSIDRSRCGFSYVACHPWAIDIHGHNMTAMDIYYIHGYL